MCRQQFTLKRRYLAALRTSHSRRQSSFRARLPELGHDSFISIADEILGFVFFRTQAVEKTLIKRRTKQLISHYNHSHSAGASYYCYRLALVTWKQTPSCERLDLMPHVEWNGVPHWHADLSLYKSLLCQINFNFYWCLFFMDILISSYVVSCAEVCPQKCVLKVHKHSICDLFTKLISTDVCPSGINFETHVLFECA